MGVRVNVALHEREEEELNLPQLPPPPPPTTPSLLPAKINVVVNLLLHIGNSLEREIGISPSTFDI